MTCEHEAEDGTECDFSADVDVLVLNGMGTWTCPTCKVEHDDVDVTAHFEPDPDFANDVARDR
jgi:hypothetical protein